MFCTSLLNLQQSPSKLQSNPYKIGEVFTFGAQIFLGPSELVALRGQEVLPLDPLNLAYKKGSR